MIEEDKFKKWIVKNNVCGKDKLIVLNKRNRVSIDEAVIVLNGLFELLDKLDLIDSCKLDFNNYNDMKLVSNILNNNKDIDSNEEKIDLYSSLFNIYLKFVLTTYKKKEDIGKYIDSINNSIDITNINIYSEAIFNELCKWPSVYVICDINGYVTKTISKDNYKLLCIPIYTKKEIIEEEYFSDEFRIKKVKLNILLNKLDNSNDVHATSIVINPNDTNNNVFIDLDESFWYYLPELGSYLE